MSGILIRPASASDVAAVRRLQELWAAEEVTRGFTPEGEEQTALRVGGPYFLVAEAEGRVVGFACGAARVSEGTAVMPAGTPYVEIEDLYVAPDARGAGVGGLLVERLLADARREGVRKALVYSASKEVRGVLKFYEGHGFEPWFVQLFRDI